MHENSHIASLKRDQLLSPLFDAKGQCMLIYRFLTGEDDSSFCHKVTKALSEGWQLHGSPSYAYDAVSKKMKCGQAVTRVAPDQPYDPDKKLIDF